MPLKFGEKKSESVFDISNNLRIERNQAYLSKFTKKKFLCPANIEGSELIDPFLGEKKASKDSLVSFHSIKNPEGKKFLLAFTDWNELKKWKSKKNQKAMILELKNYKKILEKTNLEYSGVVINPLSECIVLDSDYDMIKAFDDIDNNENNNIINIEDSSNINFDNSLDYNLSINENKQNYSTKDIYYKSENFDYDSYKQGVQVKNKFKIDEDLSSSQFISFLNEVSDFFKIIGAIKKSYIKKVYGIKSNDIMFVLDSDIDCSLLYPELNELALKNTISENINIVDYNTPFGKMACQNLDPFFEK